MATPLCLVAAECSLVRMLLQAEAHSPKDGHRGCVQSCPLRAAENRLAFPSRQYCWHQRAAVLRVHREDQGGWGRQDPPPLPRYWLVGPRWTRAGWGKRPRGKQGPGPQSSWRQGKEAPHLLPGGPGMSDAVWVVWVRFLPVSSPEEVEWSVSLRRRGLSSPAGIQSRPPSPLQNASMPQRGTSWPQMVPKAAGRGSVCREVCLGSGFCCLCIGGNVQCGFWRQADLCSMTRPSVSSSKSLSLSFPIIKMGVLTAPTSQGDCGDWVKGSTKRTPLCVCVCVCVCGMCVLGMVCCLWYVCSVWSVWAVCYI